ncbi:hypothetical protein NDU88_001996 [Pleurodeles waltl]|uniref:Uncharacterized protein n=1 Tax=Pleurodeles waltl TaxID=8319 RepID=A0AAV7P8E0_PLEWA|nr:hypothetical protein NDU88_001996 [Pleurodeles waltl]
MPALRYLERRPDRSAQKGHHGRASRLTYQQRVYEEGQQIGKFVAWSTWVRQALPLLKERSLVPVKYFDKLQPGSLPN